MDHGVLTALNKWRMKFIAEKVRLIGRIGM